MIPSDSEVVDVVTSVVTVVVQTWPEAEVTLDMVFNGSMRASCAVAVSTGSSLPARNGGIRTLNHPTLETSLSTIYSLDIECT